ncbi:fungal hydrophobin [Crassisporium funariophilum]|nr:fungal hydrophobin [Crassisporium funariophilum]
MFARVAALFFLATLGLPILAAANALEARDQCNTGAVQCCSSLQAASTTGLGQALAGGGLLGLVQIDAIINSIGGLVGLACVPLSILSLGGNSCSTQPVCCTNNYVGGIIQAGCTPINV